MPLGSRDARNLYFWKSMGSVSTQTQWFPRLALQEGDSAVNPMHAGPPAVPMLL